MKHTPGPWKAKRSGDGKCTAIDAPSPADRAEEICIVEHDDVTEESDAEAQANIALIATAPDLLEALKLMLDHSCVADADPGDKDAADHAAERAARAALTKASA